MLELLENASGIHIRWAIRRDFPQIIELLKEHPDFSSIKDDAQIEEIFLRISRHRYAIGMVAEDQTKKMSDKPASQWELPHNAGIHYDWQYSIIGYMYYTLNKHFIDAPIIIAQNVEVAKALLGKITEKIDSGHGRDALYVRAHWNKNVLIAMRELGFDTQQMEDDYILGIYPAYSKVHPDIFSKYNSLYNKLGNPQLPHSPPQSGPDDYGLFKDLPWKDPEPDPGDELH